MEKLSDVCCDPDVLVADDHAALTLACANTNQADNKVVLSIVDLLLEEDLRVSYRTSSGFHSLMLAAADYNGPVLRVLLNGCRYNKDEVEEARALSAQPCIEPLKDQMFWICFSAPEITTVSKPKRNPASAAVIDHRNSLGLEFFISATLAPCREMNMARILKTL